MSQSHGMLENFIVYGQKKGRECCVFDFFYQNKSRCLICGGYVYLYVNTAWSSASSCRKFRAEAAIGPFPPERVGASHTSLQEGDLLHLSHQKLLYPLQSCATPQNAVFGRIFCTQR